MTPPPGVAATPASGRDLRVVEAPAGRAADGATGELLEVDAAEHHREALAARVVRWPVADDRGADRARRRAGRELQAAGAGGVGWGHGSLSREDGTGSEGCEPRARRGPRPLARLPRTGASAVTPGCVVTRTCGHDHARLEAGRA